MFKWNSIGFIDITILFNSTDYLRNALNITSATYYLGTAKLGVF